MDILNNEVRFINTQINFMPPKAIVRVELLEATSEDVSRVIGTYDVVLYNKYQGVDDPSLLSDVLQKLEDL